MIVRFCREYPIYLFYFESSFYDGCKKIQFYGFGKRKTQVYGFNEKFDFKSNLVLSDLQFKQKGSIKGF